MAILRGIVSNLKGSAGELTFKRVGGDTIVSQRIHEVYNPKTPLQQQNRVKLANVVHMYNALKPYIAEGFENRSGRSTTYSQFMKYNLKNNTVYLTKEQSAAGACIAASYQVTHGSLPSINIAGTGAEGVTDIKLGSLVIDSTTTVGAFSQTVVQLNADYQYGDQVSYLSAVQVVDDLTGVPSVRVRADEVTLDGSSTATLLSVVSANGFASVSGCLGHGSSEGNCSYTWIHSRRSNGRLQVSSQTLLNNNSLCSSYTSTSAFNKAVNSYGVSQSVFLEPDVTTSTSYSDSSASSDTSSSSSSTSGSTNTHTISASANDSTMGTVSGGGTYTEGSVVTLSATANSGYHFVQWNDGSSTATRQITVSGNATYVATFAADSSSSMDD